MNNLVEKSGRKIQKVFNYIGLSIIGVFFISLISHLVWKNSGSNNWKIVSDKNGIKVSTLKTPGNTLLKYKVNMHVESKLTDVVFYISDTSTGSDVGALDVKRIEEVSTPPIFYAYDSYKLDMPPPLGQIEVMVLNQYYQNPETKIVEVNVLAAPNKMPRLKDIYRVLHLSNNWTFTPLESGGVDIESTSEMDLGIPYLLANFAMPGVVHEKFTEMREVLKKDKYKNRKPAFISEPNEEISEKLKQNINEVISS